MTDKIISVKDYARERNRSIQGVYQQMKRPVNAQLLKNHIILKTVGNREVKFLDEYAVDVLDRGRSNNPAVIVKTDTEEQLEELKQINKNQLLKIAEQADRIAAQAEELLNAKSMLLESRAKSEEEAKKREVAEAKQEELNQEIERKKAEAEALQQQLKSIQDQLSTESKKYEELQQQFETEKTRKLSFRERIFGKKKNKAVE